MPKRLLNAVRRRKSNSGSQSSSGRTTFRQRYDELEEKRKILLDRLARLGDHGRSHPSHRRAMTLLNDTFRKASVAQRLAVLQAAAWLIDLMEHSIGLI